MTSSYEDDRNWPEKQPFRDTSIPTPGADSPSTVSPACSTEVNLPYTSSTELDHKACGEWFSPKPGLKVQCKCDCHVPITLTCVAKVQCKCECHRSKVGTKDFDELYSKLSPQRREKIEERVEETVGGINRWAACKEFRESHAKALDAMRDIVVTQLETWMRYGVKHNMKDDPIYQEIRAGHQRAIEDLELTVNRLKGPVKEC